MKLISIPRLLKTLESNLNKHPLCQPPDQVLKKPDLLVGEHATDCHAHICGPDSIYPYSPNRIYTPHDALLPQYIELLKSLGISRAVLVQPSIYGNDNRALLNALQTDPVHFRGVAVVDWDISENELEHLHHSGIRGVRCNIVDLAEEKGMLPISKLRYLAEKIAPLGWHIEFLMHANEFPHLYEDLKDFPVPVVLGHLGYLKTELGIEDIGFQNLLALMREERAWVKLTGPYRISSESQPPYADTKIFARALLEANDRQIVWGSDWPHVMVKGFMPNDADLLDILQSWAPDPIQRANILSNNPARLYQFIESINKKV
ncbi:amidohydrolase family protein [Polynucleobacter antarcticus]|uniref:amidohydrolase family protein n=1 Tax=Polynucleobacter antarcticus TaxID=1743162 RepID=UPI0039EF0990